LKLFLLLILLFPISTFAGQDPIKIGEVGEYGPVITHDINDLKYGFEQEWGDGTVVNGVTIEVPVSGSYWLTGIGVKNDTSRVMTIKLYKDESNDLYICRAEEGKLGTCSGNWCSFCKIERDLFGNPTGCHCDTPVYGYCVWIPESGELYVEPYLSAQ
jgi:hypothetical protein